MEASSKNGLRIMLASLKFFFYLIFCVSPLQSWGQWDTFDWFSIVYLRTGMIGGSCTGGGGGVGTLGGKSGPSTKTSLGLSGSG